MQASGHGPSLDALAALREALAAVPLNGGGDRGAQLRARLLAELEGHLIPRVAHPQAPLVVALTGPTGSGKSTLVNSLVRGNVTQAGVLRPTTRMPVLVHRPEDAKWFPGERRRLPAWSAVHFVPSKHLPSGVALLDTPDVNSARHGRQGDTVGVLAAADVWLFVTTAARYADAAPWRTLRAIGGREPDLAVILNRVQPDAAEFVEDDLRQTLQIQELGGATVFVIVETQLEGGRLPREVVAPVNRWLAGLGAGSKHRAEVLDRTVSAAIAAMAEPVAELDRLTGGDRRLRWAAEALAAMR